MQLPDHMCRSSCKFLRRIKLTTTGQIGLDRGGVREFMVRPVIKNVLPVACSGYLLLRKIGMVVAPLHFDVCATFSSGSIGDGSAPNSAAEPLRPVFDAGADDDDDGGNVLTFPPLLILRRFAPTRPEKLVGGGGIVMLFIDDMIWSAGCCFNSLWILFVFVVVVLHCSAVFVQRSTSQARVIAARNMMMVGTLPNGCG